jgi:hypothetical protein
MRFQGGGQDGHAATGALMHAWNPHIRKPRPEVKAGDGPRTAFHGESCAFPARADASPPPQRPPVVADLANDWRSNQFQVQ